MGLLALSGLGFGLCHVQGFCHVGLIFEQNWSQVMVNFLHRSERVLFVTLWIFDLSVSFRFQVMDLCLGVHLVSGCLDLGSGLGQTYLSTTWV